MGSGYAKAQKSLEIHGRSLIQKQVEIYQEGE